MTDLLTGAGTAPFTLALAILLVLLMFEIAAALFGGSLLGMGDAGLDADVDLDMDLDLDAEFDADLGGDAEVDGATATGIGDVLGLSKVPFLVWLAMLLAGFGLSGLAIQTVLTGTIGAPLPAAFAAIPAGIGGLWTARTVSGGFARLLPRTETSALETRQLARLIGTVTQGTATRGRPAEVRVRDRHGNTHHLRAEPLRDGVTIPQGSEVLVTRDHHARALRLIPLTEGD